MTAPTAPEGRELTSKLQAYFKEWWGEEAHGMTLNALLDLIAAHDQALIQRVREALEQQQSIVKLTCNHDSTECQCIRHYIVPMEAVTAVLDELEHGK